MVPGFIPSLGRGRAGWLVSPPPMDCEVGWDSPRQLFGGSGVGWWALFMGRVRGTDSPN